MLSTKENYDCGRRPQNSIQELYCEHVPPNDAVDSGDKIDHSPTRAFSAADKLIGRGLKIFITAPTEQLGVPKEVVSRLNAEVNAIVNEREFAAVLEADGSTAIGGPPEQLATVIKSDIERWRKLVRDRQIKVE